MRKISFIIAFTLGASQLAFAQSPSACGQIRSPQDILNCAIAHHPEVQQSQMTVQRDVMLTKLAKQRPNLELGGKVIARIENGNSSLNSEVSLLHTLELGGKRSARISLAKAQYEQAVAGVLQSKEMTALHTVLALYRLSQIRHEVAIASESVGIFGRMLDNFQIRPKLSPEQQSSYSAFELERTKHKLKKLSLLEEQTNLRYFLQLATGKPFKDLQGYLPGSKSSWPKLSLSKSELALLNNSDLQRAQAQAELARAHLEIAKSQAWPDFKLGPALETQTQGTQTNVMGGVGFILPIPVFNQNRGGVAYASYDKKLSELNYYQTQLNAANDRLKHIQRYQNALSGLNSYSEARLSLKHEEVESQFSLGLVPASLIIETHHQVHDITEAIHQHELNAIDALWRVYILEGRFTREKL